MVLVSRRKKFLWGFPERGWGVSYRLVLDARWSPLQPAVAASCLGACRYRGGEGLTLSLARQPQTCIYSGILSSCVYVHSFRGNEVHPFCHFSHPRRVPIGRPAAPGAQKDPTDPRKVPRGSRKYDPMQPVGEAEANTPVKII